MMCELQLLYYSEEGQIVRCPYCKHIQLAYGDTLRIFNEVDFRTFHRIVNAKRAMKDTVSDERIHQVVLPTPYAGIHRLITLEELDFLNHMLDEASTELTSLTLLELFEKS